MTKTNDEHIQFALVEKAIDLNQLVAMVTTPDIGGICFSLVLFGALLISKTKSWKQITFSMKPLTLWPSRCLSR